MKKFINVSFFAFIFWSVGSFLSAQSKVSFSIQKEEIEGEHWVRVFITNNSSEDMPMFSAASWDHRGIGYLRTPLSYIRFIGNPEDSTSRYETKQIILSKASINDKVYKTPNFVIKSGETHTEVYQLFGETYYPIRSFIVSYMSKLKELQAELTYFYVEEECEKIILSNILEYDIK